MNIADTRCWHMDETMTSSQRCVSKETQIILRYAVLVKIMKNILVFKLKPRKRFVVFCSNGKIPLHKYCWDSSYWDKFSRDFHRVQKKYRIDINITERVVDYRITYKNANFVQTKFSLLWAGNFSIALIFIRRNLSLATTRKYTVPNQCVHERFS